MRKQKQQVQTLEEKYPNEAQFTGGKERQVPEGNHFENEDLSEFRRRYVRFSFIMELLHEILDLDKQSTTPVQLLDRMQDIVIASRREE